MLPLEIDGLPVDGVLKGIGSGVLGKKRPVGAAGLAHEGRHHLVAHRNGARPHHHAVYPKVGRPHVGPVAKDETQCVYVPLSGFGVVGGNVTPGVPRNYLDNQVWAQADNFANPIVFLVGLAASQQEIGPEPFAFKSVGVAALLPQEIQGGLRQSMKAPSNPASAIISTTAGSENPTWLTMARPPSRITRLTRFSRMEISLNQKSICYQTTAALGWPVIESAGYCVRV